MLPRSVDEDNTPLGLPYAKVGICPRHGHPDQQTVFILQSNPWRYSCTICLNPPTYPEVRDDT